MLALLRLVSHLDTNLITRESISHLCLLIVAFSWDIEEN